jgi:hypothetical protein
MLGGRWSLKKIGAALGVGARLYIPWASASTPSIPVQSPDLQSDANTIAGLVRDFGLKLPHVFMRLKDEETFAQAELVHERIADIAIDLYVASCVLARLDHLASHPSDDPFADPAAGKYFLKIAIRRIREHFASLDDNDDDGLLAAARPMITKL